VGECKELCFWAIVAVVDRVSRAPVVVGSAGEFEGVPGGVGEEKMAVSGEVSLEESIFEFLLLFPGHV
jgi:hypothetical protein